MKCEEEVRLKLLEVDADLERFRETGSSIYDMTLGCKFALEWVLHEEGKL